MQQETKEQFDLLNFDYKKLLGSYNNLLKVDSVRRRESEEIAAIKVLRDKLMGKDTEIQHQVKFCFLICALKKYNF